MKALYVARLGRPDCLWTINHLARYVTKWNKACDKRLHRLICYIWHKKDYMQHCFVGNEAKDCFIGVFTDASFAGDTQDSKSTSGCVVCLFGSKTFVPLTWFCKKQTAVSHSSTEAEFIALDAALRLEGIPCLQFWELVVSVFHPELVFPLDREPIDTTRIDAFHVDWVPPSFPPSKGITGLYILKTMSPLSR